MDHDAVESRLAKVERFLDAQAPGWQDQARWLRPNNAAPVHEPLLVDEDQTRNDREALGLPVDGGEPLRAPGEVFRPGPAGADAKPEDDAAARRTAVLTQLEAYRGMDGVAPWDGTETIEQLEVTLTNARERKTTLDAAAKQAS